MTSGDDASNDTAMAVALKRAASAKLLKQQKKREEREATKQARLDRLKVKQQAAEDHPPTPVPAPRTGAALQVEAQHFLQDKAKREQRIRQLSAIAMGRASTPEPVVVQRLPPPPPSGPDDPRVLNGTLAPSPKVAAILRASVSEAATEAAATKPPRPEQTGRPEAWLEVLRSGTPSQILACRRAKDLKGDDLEAFNRARRREIDAVLAGRRLKDLSAGELQAYHAVKARHLALIVDHNAPRAVRKGAARSAVGRVIDKFRHEAGLTVRQLAEQAGLSRYRLTNAIAGRQQLRREEAALLGHFFNVNPEPFMTSTTTTSPSKAKAPPVALNGVTPPKTNPKRPGYNEQHDLKRLLELTEPRDSDSYFQASLRRIMRSRGLMAQHVAKLCGLSSDVPGRLLRTGMAPAPATREKLINGLGVAEAELFGSDDPQAEAAPVAARGAVQAEALAPVAQVAEDDELTPEEARGAFLATPMVPVELDVPMPPIFLRSDRYPWNMPKGGSFKAEVPFGMPWATFRSRFVKMIDRQSESLGHWYTFEESPDQGLIRVWRVI
jgi:transcriptional regulator with XRE-family HTH domain